ncbi:glycosyltransferase family 4 protein [Halostella sp. JP-L12]|uniref:glycosyltransferase n=1 Tax=Halostella TaxID=1843185 RepID=UPI000EF7A3E0|nr:MULTISPECIES: glycosyltransferase [Halostella]NHN46541.1 glycosyltransferase family 4 protein [Halostella sp. JP-L12]
MREDQATVGIIAFGPVASRSTGYHVRTHHIAEQLGEICKDVFVFELQEPSERDQVSENYTTVALNTDTGQKDEGAGFLEEYLTFDVFEAITFQLESIAALWKIRSKLAECDIVLVGGALIPAGIIVSKLAGVTTVLDTHCINKRLADGFRDRNFIAYLLRRVLWDVLERFGTKASDAVIAVSNQEAQFVVNDYGVNSSNVHVIPNVVELPDLETDTGKLRSLRDRLDLEGKRVATFVGALGSVQNRDAVQFLVEELAPCASAANHEIVFLVIGEGGTEWNETPDNVIFTGYVDDLGPYMELSDVSIAPLRVGAGTKTKVLEYMVYDNPVLTTEKGAESLPIDSLSGVEVVTQETFTEQLPDFEELFDDYENGNRAFIAQRYTPQSIEDDLRELLKICGGTSKLP